MGLESFIPTIWSARILQNLHKTQVYSQAGVINRDYEGEISNAGDSVKINAIGAVTVGNYTKNTSIGTPETLDGAATTLVIDQQKFFNFMVDDIDRVQQTPKMMEEAMREAGYALADTLDTYLSGLAWQQTAAANMIGTNAAPKTDAATDKYAYNYLLQLGTLLTESNVPREGRWIVLPPWYVELLLKDSRFINPGTPEAEARMANAVVGRLAGFTILESNNVPNTNNDNYKIIAGHSMAWTLAEQIVKVVAYRPEGYFSDAVKGLHVYGAKVIRPTALAVLHIDRP